MKNKNNITANELADLVLKHQQDLGNTSAYAYLSGTLIALLQEALNLDEVPKKLRWRNIQDVVNSCAEDYKAKLAA